MPLDKDSANKPTYQPNKPFDPAAWVYSDCAAIDCEEGFIHADRDGYATLYGCPRCQRYKDQVPAIKEWDGPLPLRTKEEMGKRQNERHDLHRNQAERRKRGMEIVREMAEMFEAAGKVRV